MNSKQSILIYCTDWCEYLHDLVDLLQRNNQPYSFFNTRYIQSIQGTWELSKINDFSLPILSIDGHLYTHPDLLKVQQLLDHRNWLNKIDKDLYGKIN